MEYQVPFGRSTVEFNLPDNLNVDLIEPTETAGLKNPELEVAEALANAQRSGRWSVFSGSKSVAIAINDKTRPVPHHFLLPPLLEWLRSLGVPSNAIKFYIAVGSHAAMTADEFSSILPEDIIHRYQVISHNSNNEKRLQYIGNTSYGSPVWVNREYYLSEFKIVVGNIEPHQFAGYSGGVKTAAIGLAGMETIKSNHNLMTRPGSILGRFDNNPARQDIEEIGAMIKINFALNAILNRHKQIVKIFAGTPTDVMHAGIPYARGICQVPVKRKYDLVISSPGGHPKDINVYQAQKGLSHAAMIVKPNGTIILVAACPDGSGSPHYENWVKNKQSYAQVLHDFEEEGFNIGPHKAYQIAKDAINSRLLFYSMMDFELSKSLLLNPVHDIQKAIEVALHESCTTVGIMPYASSTIPNLVEI